ncbi:PhoX family phosphatase [Pseudophaeobacter sp.]|uniref:PhoX family protein n=1 Tax=Pseudophaeobacter sp. TaxID=1971739 RepID=UPI00329A0FC3
MDHKHITDDPEIGNKAEAYEAFDDIPTNPNLEATIGDVINARYGRRDLLRGMLGVSAAASLFGSSALIAPHRALAAEARNSRYRFDELTPGNDQTHHIAAGYDAEVLLRWGDPITADAPEFDVMNQSAAAQLQQFGYNNDYVGFTPLNAQGTRGLLCVNHEYTNEEVMFPGLGRQDKQSFAGMTKELIDIEMAAHGGTVVEIARDAAGKWSLVRNSAYNRRITPLHTEMTIDGPAAGHKRMQTKTDATGKAVIGTLNNCAGGMTPWGTWLMAEENFHGYFWTDTRDSEGKADLSSHADAASKKRYGIPSGWYAWGQYYDRFNIDKDPNESNRFGWVVEVDPRMPNSKPVKHTALGRFRHEGCETTISTTGKLVVYMGDDNRFDYQYKYVSNGTVSRSGGANSKLLRDGTLYVARFDADGTVHWLPLVHGEGPLTAENGFASQADVLIDTRLAADALGATPMDRPEDAQPRGDGTAYIMLTNNSRRKTDQINAANPRAKNAFGHIIEIKEDAGDHAATSGSWSILVSCGDPNLAEVGAQWNPQTSESGWFASPDNCAFDAQGRLWIATDQGRKWGKTGKSDGLYALETEGGLRGHSKLFFRCPVGAELCGPYFTEDSETLFLAVQHPGTDGTKSLKGFARASTFEDPATRWPDFDPKMPPRPSVLVVTKTGGGKIAV